MSSDKAGLLAMFQTKVLPIQIDLDGQIANLYVRELNAKQVFDLQDERKKAEAAGTNATKKFAVQMVSEGLCNEDGTRMFTTAQAEDLLQLKMSAFNKLAETVAEAIGLGAPPKKDGEQKAGAEAEVGKG
jgi:hypothetical protein